MLKKMFGFKRVVIFLAGWLLLGFVGRSMMKYYDIETYRESLKNYAWLDNNERRYNLLVLTGPACYLYSIIYIVVQNEPKWGMVFDFKAEKILTWEEFQRLKKSKKPTRPNKSKKDFGITC